MLRIAADIQPRVESLEPKIITYPKPHISGILHVLSQQIASFSVVEDSSVQQQISKADRKHSCFCDYYFLAFAHQCGLWF